MNPNLDKTSGDGVRQAAVFATLAYLAVAFVVLGSIAVIASMNMQLEPPNTDIWQHAASVRALIVDLGNPSNPFVLSDESSRHFQPLWVMGAAVAQFFGLTEWDILRIAAYLSMLSLGLGVFLFAKAYFASPWAPVVLLLVIVFGWGLQPAHTGHHSFRTLLYTAPYPATFLIGFSLISWAMTIRALGNLRYAILLSGLVAFMFTTHQLGALIGLIGVGCFVLLWPDVSFRSRFIVSLAVIVGLGVSAMWPYHNPFALVLRPGNSSWEGGARFYGYIHLFAAFVPAAIGILHFREAMARPVALTFLAYGSIFLIGLTGLQIAGRFLAPIALVLQIGLTGVILGLLQNQNIDSSRRKLVLGFAGVAILFSYMHPLVNAFVDELDVRTTGVKLYDIAQELTADIPAREAVAASPYAVWPIVASGQRVVSIPWPEPGIRDLAERQQATASLFDADLTREERLEIARHYNTRTLMADIRFLPSATVEKLRMQAVHVEQISYIIRFDLVSR